MNSTQRPSVCWLGGTRYTRPLNPTQDAKWRALAELCAAMYVIGFSATLRPRRFTQGATFYLLPELPSSFLRYIEIFLIAPVLIFWLVFRHRVQVIVTQSPIDGAIGGWLKQIAALLGRRVVLIVENHGDFEVSVFTQRQVMFARLYRWLIRRCAQYAFQQADALRAISSMTRRQAQHFAPDKPIEQFMTWTDADVFLNTPREIPIAKSQDIVYAGILIPRKGVHFLIDAFVQIAVEFPDARLWLVGKPENMSYAAQLRRQVERAGLGARVTFVGAVQQQELAHYMGRGRVFVLPSISEGLGRVIVEAMLCGTPAIGSQVDGIPDLIHDQENGYLVPVGDVEALVAALRRVYNDPNIDAMGERARAFARQFFSTEAYVEGYRRLIDSALNPSPLPSVALPVHGEGE